MVKPKAKRKLKSSISISEKNDGTRGATGVTILHVAPNRRAQEPKTEEVFRKCIQSLEWLFGCT